MTVMLLFSNAEFPNHWAEYRLRAKGDLELGRKEKKNAFYYSFDHVMHTCFYHIGNAQKVFVFFVLQNTLSLDFKRNPTC